MPGLSHGGCPRVGTQGGGTFIFHRLSGFVGCLPGPSPGKAGSSLTSIRCWTCPSPGGAESFPVHSGRTVGERPTCRFSSSVQNRAATRPLLPPLGARAPGRTMAFLRGGFAILCTGLQHHFPLSSRQISSKGTPLCLPQKAAPRAHTKFRLFQGARYLLVYDLPRAARAGRRKWAFARSETCHLAVRRVTCRQVKAGQWKDPLGHPGVPQLQPAGSTPPQGFDIYLGCSRGFPAWTPAAGPREAAPNFTLSGGMPSGGGMQSWCR